MASDDGSTVIVRSGLDKAARRRAVRDALSTTRRYPSLALWPALASFRLRRLAASIGETTAAAGQHLASLLPVSPGVASIAATAVAAAVTVTAAAGAIPGVPGLPGSAGHGAAAGKPPAVHVTLPVRPLSYLGVFEDDAPDSYAGVSQFAATSGRNPNIALYYSGWGEQFRAMFAYMAYSQGAVPAVQIDPVHVSLAAIAAGQQDAYLNEYAAAVRKFGHAVIIGFAHEMNGSWYPWGAGHLSPAIWVKAWQHIVNVFRADGADNVTWLWTVSRVANEPLAAWWPGSAYVTWIGIDGYYENQRDTFRSLFGPAISQIRRFTGDPVLISEAAVGQLAGQHRGIVNLFSSIRRSGYLGFIWFDKNQAGSTYRQEWRLETDSPATIAAFRQEAAGWGLLHRGNS